MKYFLLFLLFISSTQATEITQGYQWINQIRLQAGLSALSINKTLQQTAENHANYLFINNHYNQTNLHYEYQSYSGFTGESSVERAEFTGYRHTHVSENVSFQQDNLKHSIDDLMGAIYHRLLFLNPLIDEIGLAKKNDYYVFNMGREDISQQCKRKAKIKTYYTDLCNNQGIVYVEELENLNKQKLMQAPEIIQWPSANATDIPPAFFNESPDPLPDYAVSGYPISLQFNKLKVKSFKILNYQLTELTPQGEKNIFALRVLDYNTDPNQKIDKNQWVLFPLQRLHWNTTYKVKIDLMLNHKRKTLNWRFKTQDLNLPIYTIQDKNITLAVRNNRDYALYIPPQTKTDKSFENIVYSYPQDFQYQTDIIDFNTLHIKVKGDFCQIFTIKTNNNYTINLKISPKDNIYKNYSDAELYANCPEYNADYTIKGQYETLALTPYKESVILVQGAPITTINCKGNIGNMKLKLEENAVYITLLDGISGSCYLNNNRVFYIKRK